MNQGMHPAMLFPPSMAGDELGMCWEDLMTYPGWIGGHNLIGHDAELGLKGGDSTLPLEISAAVLPKLFSGGKALSSVGVVILRGGGLVVGVIP